MSTGLCDVMFAFLSRDKSKLPVLVSRDRSKLLVLLSRDRSKLPVLVGGDSVVGVMKVGIQ